MTLDEAVFVGGGVAGDSGCKSTAVKGDVTDEVDFAAAVGSKHVLNSKRGASLK